MRRAHGVDVNGNDVEPLKTADQSQSFAGRCTTESGRTDAGTRGVKEIHIETKINRPACDLVMKFRQHIGNPWACRVSPSMSWYPVCECDERHRELLRYPALI